MRKTMALLLAVLLLGTGCAAAEKGNTANIIAKPSGSGNGIPGAGSVEELSDIPKSDEMTIMVYMCGSNLEEDAAAASRDMIEMMESGFSTENLNLIVMTGGSHRWGLPMISSEETGIYQIGNHGLKCLYNCGQHYNMGDPETLRTFLDFGYTNFPADRYALVLWNHGGGSLLGICNDMLYEADRLSMAELRKALDESPAASGKMSWIGFDACIMGSGEVAEVIAPYADFMIASEEFEPGFGWNYAFLGGMAKGESPAETGARITDLYIASCEEMSRARGKSSLFTLSCIDLSKMDPLKEKMEEFFATVNLVGDNFVKASKSRRSIISFGRDEETPDQDFDLIDLGDMIRKLAPYGDEEKANQALEALGNCVITSKTTENDRNCTGLTVYFPYYNKMLYTAARDLYNSLSIASQYTAAVQSFGDMLVRGPEEEMGNVNNVSVGDGKRDNRTIVQLKLEENQAKYADLAEIIALQKTEGSKGWRLVARQHASVNEDGMATGEYVHTNLFVVDEKGEPIYEEPMLYTERDDGLISIPVILTDADQNEVEARVICHRETGEYQLSVVDLYLYDETINGYSSRLTGDLADYVSASYTVEEKTPVSFEDREGSPLLPYEKWETAETYRRSWDLSGGWNLSFVRDYLDIKTISVLFQITDVFNTVYLSAPVPVTGAEKSIQLTYDDNQRVLIDQQSVKLTPNGMLFLKVKNTGTAETLMNVNNVQINGTAREMETEIPGFGEHDGLNPEEEQIAILQLPLEEGENVENVNFSINLRNAEETETETENIEVNIHIGSGVW